MLEHVSSEKNLAENFALQDVSDSLVNSISLLTQEGGKACIYSVNGKPPAELYLGEDFLGSTIRSAGALFAPTVNLIDKDSAILYLELNLSKVSDSVIQMQLVQLKNYIETKLANVNYTGLILVIGGEQESVPENSCSYLAMLAEKVLLHELQLAHGYFSKAVVDKYNIFHVLTLAPNRASVSEGTKSLLNVGVDFEDNVSTKKEEAEKTEKVPEIESDSVNTKLESLLEKSTEEEDKISIPVILDEQEVEPESIERKEITKQDEVNNFNQNDLYKIVEENIVDLRITTQAWRDGKIIRGEDIDRINYVTLPILFGDGENRELKRCVCFSDSNALEMFKVLPDERKPTFTVAFNNGKTYIDVVDEIEQPLMLDPSDLLSGDMMTKILSFIDRLFEENKGNLVPSELTGIFNEPNFINKIISLLTKK